MTRNTEKFLILGVVVLMITFGMRLRGAQEISRDVAEEVNAAGSAVSPVATLTSDDVPLLQESRFPEVPSLANADGDTSRRFRRVRNTAPPEITAQAAVIADLETGETFYELAPHSRWPIASLTKLVTGVTAMKHMNLESRIALAPSDFSSGGNALTKNLEAGQTFSLKDMIAILLVSSSNEAGEAIAKHYGREEFLARMNEQAEAWGLRETYFADPAGISAANQSTAYELKSLARHIYTEYPEIFRLTRRKTVTVTETFSGARYQFSNTNEFAGGAGFLGGKTGYTPEADGNLISIFSHGSRPVVVIVLGTENRFGETEQLWNWFSHDFVSSR